MTVWDGFSAFAGMTVWDGFSAFVGMTVWDGFSAFAGMTDCGLEWQIMVWSDRLWLIRYDRCGLGNRCGLARHRGQICQELTDAP